MVRKTRPRRPAKYNTGSKGRTPTVWQRASRPSRAVSSACNAWSDRKRVAGFSSRSWCAPHPGRRAALVGPPGTRHRATTCGTPAPRPGGAQGGRTGAAVGLQSAARSVCEVLILSTPRNCSLYVCKIVCAVCSNVLAGETRSDSIGAHFTDIQWVAYRPGFAPRFFGANSRSEPLRRALRQAVRWELYNPSRRSSRPTSPRSADATHASAVPRAASRAWRRRKGARGCR